MKTILTIIISCLIFTSGFCDTVRESVIHRDGKVISVSSYKNDKDVPIKLVEAANGKEYHWSFFNDGYQYLDEEDTTGNGKVNFIVLTIDGPDKKSQRSISIALKDVGKNIFVVNEDTGWKK